MTNTKLPMDASKLLRTRYCSKHLKDKIILYSEQYLGSECKEHDLFAKCAHANTTSLMRAANLITPHGGVSHSPSINGLNRRKVTSVMQ